MILSGDKVYEIVQNHRNYLGFNYELLDIYDNNISEYIERDLKDQLSPQSFQQAMHRLSPINILPKVIDKLTNIYQTAVTREVIGGNSTDEFIFDKYKELMRVNEKMNISNELFNLCQATLIYPKVSNGIPLLSTIENDKFIVHSSDPMAPNTPTEVIILAGKMNGLEIFWCWDAYNFWVTDSDGKTRYDIMASFENEEGINPIGRLPFVYVNESQRCLMPRQDRDMLRILKLIPVMLSDLNLAAMFQCFSILYTIDAQQENLTFAPNAMWDIKSEPQSEKAPQIGSIKPTVDYTQVMSLIESQLSMWLGTKGIKASSIGGLTQDNFASGISKIIDEMDTFEARQKQTTTFVQVEKELWDLILNGMHPYWQKTGQISISGTFSPSAFIKTDFAVQLPTQTRGQVVRDVKEEYSSGFTTKRRALMKINPEMSEKEIDELIMEIESEFEVEEPEMETQEIENMEMNDDASTES